jgi:hypothetical protein
MDDNQPIEQKTEQPEQEQKSSNGMNFLILLGLIAIGAFIYLGRNPSPSEPLALPTPTNIVIIMPPRIVYLVDGTTPIASLTYRNRTGGTEQITVRTPWEFSFEAAPGEFLYLSAQNETDSGYITCKITNKGEGVASAKSTAPYGIASCSGVAELKSW